MRRVVFMLVVAIAICGWAWAQQAAPAPVGYAKQVKPILQTNCVSCHSASMSMANVRVDTKEGVLALVKPGSSARSRLFRVMESGAMPPGRKMAEEKVSVVRTWIDQGATIDE